MGLVLGFSMSVQSREYFQWKYPFNYECCNILRFKCTLHVLQYIATIKVHSKKHEENSKFMPLPIHLYIPESVIFIFNVFHILLSYLIFNCCEEISWPKQLIEERSFWPS